MTDLETFIRLLTDEELSRLPEMAVTERARRDTVRFGETVIADQYRDFQLAAGTKRPDGYAWVQPVSVYDAYCKGAIVKTPTDWKVSTIAGNYTDPSSMFWQSKKLPDGYEPDPLALAEPYAVYKTYNIGERVIFDKKRYICVAPVKGKTPAEQASDAPAWALEADE